MSPLVALRRAAWVSWGLALGVLGGCGGGDTDVRWCISLGSGTLSLGVDAAHCPPRADQD